MDKYIKVSDAIDYFLRNVNWSDEDGYQIEDYAEKRKIYEGLFDSIPAADVEERKVGKWILAREADETGNALYECSACHMSETHSPIVEVKYCWNCGAKMEGNE